MTKIQKLFAGLILVLILALAGWQVAIRRSGDDLIIGVLAPFGSTAGEGIRAGVAMAVDELNAQGGIDGQAIRVIEVDTAFSVDETVRGYSMLSSQGAVAVIGIAGDGVFAVMEKLEEHQVPLLCTGTGADALTRMVAAEPERYRWFFRVMHSSSELAEVTSSYARDLLFREQGVKRFAIMVENAVWTEAIREQWQATIAATEGMELVFSDSFSSETADFQPLLSRIDQAGAEYILDASSKVEATHYLKQWAAVQGPPIGAIPTGAGTQKYYDELGEAGVAVASVSTIPSEINQVTERSATWWASYQEQYGDPEYTSGYSYDAVYILAQALQRSDLDLVEALELTDHPGVAGRWVFQQDHHPRYGTGYRSIPIIQYYEPAADGYRIIWPADRAQGDWVRPRWEEAGP